MHKAVVPLHLVEYVERASDDGAAREHYYIGGVLRSRKAVLCRALQNVRRPHKYRRAHAGENSVFRVTLNGVYNGKDSRGNAYSRLRKQDNAALGIRAMFKFSYFYPSSHIHLLFPAG